jgi:hypothetical protein
MQLRIRLAPGATNQTSNNDPLLLNNTCNDVIDLDNIGINSSHLKGETTDTDVLWAENFSIYYETGGAACAGGGCIECDGSKMDRNESIGIVGANLSKGNFTVNDGVIGQEQLYFCLMFTDSTLSDQAYSTAAATEWPWVVEIL